MENNKKRKLSGTILAGTFAVPAALSTAQQNITSANLFTDVCSSASSFFTKKAGESTFSFLFSRFVTCIGVVVVAIGLYRLYKYLFPNENGGNNSKEENIENNKIKEEDNLDGVQEKTAREILRSVRQKKERYIKEVIREIAEQLQIKDKEEKEKLVNIIFKQLDISKIKEKDINIESMLPKSEVEAQKKAVDIVKNKIRETYGKEIENLIKTTLINKATKIQAVYKLYRIKRQIDNVYEKNKEFLDNFKISEDPALSFGITFDKDVEKNENNGNRVDVSVKKENDTIKVTFKRGKEEKTSDIEKSKGGLRSLEELVRLSKQDLKYKINSLYITSNNYRFLKKFEIDEKDAKAFVQFKKENKENKGKVSVTTKKEDEKITFTFKNGDEEKNFEVPVTKDGYKKLENLINLAKEYYEKKAEEEKKKNSNLDIIDNENIIIEGKENNCVNNQVKDENLEQFEKFKEEFRNKFNDEVKKNDPRNYLTLEEKNDKIEVVYTSNAWYKYPLDISYNSNKKVFELHYEWTWYNTRTFENKTVGSSEEAIKWFLEKFQSMYRYTTSINTIFRYNNGELVLLDGDKRISLENSGTKITNND